MPHYLYRHFDADGCLLYVGTSMKPDKRTYQHSKNADWFSGVETVKIELVDSKRAAMAAESRVIREENPKYNRMDSGGTRISGSKFS